MPTQNEGREAHGQPCWFLSPWMPGRNEYCLMRIALCLTGAGNQGYRITFLRIDRGRAVFVSFALNAYQALNDVFVIYFTIRIVVEWTFFDSAKYRRFLRVLETVLFLLQRKSAETKYTPCGDTALEGLSDPAVPLSGTDR